MKPTFPLAFFMAFAFMCISFITAKTKEHPQSGDWAVVVACTILTAIFWYLTYKKGND